MKSPADLPSNRYVQQLLEQLEKPGNTAVHLPDRFNFGFDVIDEAAAQGDAVAYLEVSTLGDEVREHRFSDLRARSNRFANFLRSLEVQRGECAVVVLPRVPAWYEVVIGCIKLGVVPMPGTPLLTARDLSYRINKASATMAVVSAEHVEKVAQIRQECPTLQHLVVVGDATAGWHAYDECLEGSSAELDVADVGHSLSTDMMMAYFTSGTTSDPKMVPRSHGYALAHTVTGAYWLNLSPGDVHWTLTDTGWAKAAWGMLFSPWLMGSTLILHNGVGFDAELHLSLVKRLGVTSFCAPPTIFRMFAQMDLSAYDLSSITHTVAAGEPLNPEVIRVWQEATGTTIYDGYGQTETVNIAANTPSFPVKPGSMGKATPGFDVQIIDDDGNIVGDDEIGHIAVRVTDPAPIGLFDGYYDGPGLLNRASFKHGWYYTGDTATRDADGYIWFVGRADDVISSAGYRISPFEVESALLEHPAVAESAVVGKPDDIRGFIVKAFVVLADEYTGSDALTTDIQNHVKAITAPYKYPREIEYRESLPKTISGKIRRVELRAEA